MVFRLFTLVMATQFSLLALSGPAAAGEAADLWAACQVPDVRQQRTGQEVTLEVDLGAEASPGFSLAQDARGREARYDMAFNNVTEGWSWRQREPEERQDSYRHKFLPLEAQEETKGRYGSWNPFEGAHEVARRWRYEYFFAFENLREFFHQAESDGMAFTARLPLKAGSVRLRLLATLTSPVVAESNTFWQSTGANRPDYTLRKRYLMGRLDAICFLDAAGAPLAEARPLACNTAAPGTSGAATPAPRCARPCAP